MDVQSLEQRVDAAYKRYKAHTKEREAREKALAAANKPGEWRNVDDPGRILWRLNSSGLSQQAAYLLEHDQPPVPRPGALKSRKNASFLERIIGEDELLNAAFLPVGAAIRRSVGRVVERRSGFGFGTGFLVSQSLLMTNNHVLPTQNDAVSSMIQFDYLTWPGGRQGESILFGLEPERFFVTDVGLDYTLVAVEPVNVQGEQLENRGWSHLIEQSGKVIFSDLVNIIQHPDGRPQRVSLRENRIVSKVSDFLHYEADTQRGSSGSPVYNDRWELGALHHSGVPKTDNQGHVLLVDATPWGADPATEHQIDWIANEGVRISSIVSDLKSRYSTFTSEQQNLFDATFEQYSVKYNEARPGVDNLKQTMNEPRIDASGRVHWTVPLDISVGLGVDQAGFGAPPLSVTSPAVGGRSPATGIITPLLRQKKSHARWSGSRTSSVHRTMMRIPTRPHTSPIMLLCRMRPSWMSGTDCSMIW